MDNEKGKLENRLQNFGSEPSPEIWGNLEAHLAKKRKPRAPFWWFLAAGLFLPMMAGIWFWNSNETRTVSNHVTIQTDSKEKIKNQNPKNNNQKSGEIRKVSPQNPEGEKVSNTQTTEENNSQSENQNLSLSNSETVQNKSAHAFKKGKIRDNKTSIALVNPSVNGINQETKPDGEFASEKKSVRKKPKSISIATNSTSSSSPILTKTNSNNETEQKEILVIRKDDLDGSKNTLVKNDPKISNKNLSNSIVEDKISNSIEENQSRIINEKEKIKESTEIDANNSPSGNKNSIEKIIIANLDSSNKIISTKYALKIDSMATNSAKPDSGKTEKKFRKSAWFVFAGVKASVFRTISINQNTGESRILIDKQASSISSRLGYDAGFRYEHFFNSWLGINGSLGFSVLQDEIHFDNRVKADGYELIAKNGELQSVQKTSSSREKIKSTLAASFCSFGLSFRPIKGMPVFRLNGGLQSNFFTSILKETSGISAVDLSKKWAFQKPVYSFQISAAQPILLKKGELWIEPFYQYYTGKVFEFRPGNYSMPGQIGLQVSWKW